jgi:hypothetical protein
MPLHASTVNVTEKLWIHPQEKDSARGVLFSVIAAFCCAAAKNRPPPI